MISEDDDEIDISIGERSAKKTRENSASTGTLYHKILENVDFFKTEKGDIEKLLVDMENNGEISTEEKEKIDVDIISKVLKLPVFSEIRSGEYHRESAFMLYVPANTVIDSTTATDKVLVQGVIDLVGLKDDAILVDYKYSSKPEELLKKEYEKQLSVYKLAIEKILNKKVKKAYLVLIKTAKCVEVDV